MGRRSPFSPRLRFPPWGGAPVPRRGPAPLTAAVGRGAYSVAIAGQSVRGRVRASACVPRACVGGVGTPGRLWGCPCPTHSPVCVCVWAPDAPSCEAFRPTGLLCFPLTRPARGDPPAPHALHPAAPRGRVGRGEEEGGQCAVPPFQTKHVRLLAVDHSARASMKNAASCEN